MSEQVFNLNEKAYNYYITNVRGNAKVSFDLAQKKLTRNIKMSKKLKQSVWQKLTGKQVYQYGNLLITLSKDTIVEVVNHKGDQLPGWKFNKAAKKKWNKKLEIK